MPGYSELVLKERPFIRCERRGHPAWAPSDGSRDGDRAPVALDQSIRAGQLACPPLDRRNDLRLGAQRVWRASPRPMRSACRPRRAREGPRLLVPTGHVPRLTRCRTRSTRHAIASHVRPVGCRGSTQPAPPLNEESVQITFRPGHTDGGRVGTAPPNPEALRWHDRDPPFMNFLWVACEYRWLAEPVIDAELAEGHRRPSGSAASRT